jgi:hypothetical protein
MRESVCDSYGMAWHGLACFQAVKKNEREKEQEETETQLADATGEYG